MTKNRFKPTRTSIPGVYYIVGTAVATGKPERIYYVSYYRDGKRHFEKAGRQYQDAMTPARAAAIRADRIRGKELPNRERREAARAIKEAEAGRWTIGRLWKEYVEQRHHGKADLTDKANYENHLEESLGRKVPSEIVPLDVDRLRVRLLKTHAPATVAKVLGLLRRLVNFGEKKRLADGPGFKIQLPPVNNEKTEFLTNEQMAAYIKVCREWPDPQAGAFQLFLLLTGVRRGEARTLKWSDVDLERNLVTLREPKGGRDVVIPISNATRELLEFHPRDEGNSYVFSGRMGGARGIKQIAKAAREIRAAAGLPDSFRPSHGLRHAFASLLASSGEVDMHVLQRLLGHKSPQMTQRYAHLRDDTLRRGVNVISRFVSVAEKQGKKVD